MKRILGLGLLGLVGSLGVPSVAHAITVNCSSPDGDCTVSNDGGIDDVFCTCAFGSGGTTGGNVWAGFNAAELLVVCEMELAVCEPFGSTTFSATTAGPATFGSVGFITETTDGGSVSTAETTGPPATDGTTSSSSGTSGSSSSSSGGIDPTINPPGTSSSGDPGMTGASMTAGNMSTTGMEPTGSTGDDGAQANTDESGCGCTTSSPAALGPVLLLAILGIRRRRS